MQTEWRTGTPFQGPGWRRFEWALFIANCVLLVVLAISYWRDSSGGAGSVLLMSALVAITGGPLLPERLRVLRWIVIAAAFVLLGFAFRAI